MRKLTILQENYPPELSNPYVLPEWGSPATIYSYYVTYKDENGYNPTEVKVELRIKYFDLSVDVFNMNKVDGSITTGATYCYKTNHIISDYHQFYYYCEDEDGESDQTNPLDGPEIISPSTVSNLHVDGKYIKDSDDNIITLRGICITDPEVIYTNRPDKKFSECS